SAQDSALSTSYVFPLAISVPACRFSVRKDTAVNSASFAAFITVRTLPKLMRLSALIITARPGFLSCSALRYFGRSRSGIQSCPTKTVPSCLMEMVRSVSFPGLFSECGPVGRRTSTPDCSIGVTTMKMMRSTRQTSTSGVTLMSPLISSGLPPPGPNAMLGLLSCRGRGAARSYARLVLDEVVDELRRRVRHLHLEAIDLVQEVVVHPDRRNGHEESESSGH